MNPLLQRIIQSDIPIVSAVDGPSRKPISQPIIPIINNSATADNSRPFTRSRKLNLPGLPPGERVWQVDSRCARCAASVSDSRFLYGRRSMGNRRGNFYVLSLSKF